MVPGVLVGLSSEQLTELLTVISPVLTRKVAVFVILRWAYPHRREIHCTGVTMEKVAGKIDCSFQGR